MTRRSLQGKAAIVTGAGRGMGRSIALGLAEAGVGVALASRTESELEAARAEIEAAGGSAITVQTDMAEEEQILRLVQVTLERFGRLDIVVNNAGVGAGGPWETLPTSKWDSVMAINARGPYILCREAIPHLRRQGGGHILNIQSIGGEQYYPNYSIYSASKNALKALTITLSKDLRKDNIRVHAISMGAVDTPLIRRGLKNRPELKPELLIQPEEIADIVLFLVTWPGRGVIDAINIRRPDADYWA